MFAHVAGVLLMFLPPRPPTSAHAGASGELRVTAIVTSSVSVTFDDEGTPRVVVANAPADADTIVLAFARFERAKNRDHKTVKESANSHKKKSENKGVKHASIH
jgi:hypothetical protein